MRIGLLSDTHGFLDPALLELFEGCDEVWHAGDIGMVQVVDQLEQRWPLRAVWGNIDGGPLRVRYPEHQDFVVEGVRVWITHIGGHPGRWGKGIKAGLAQRKPDLFICGHSHILRAARVEAYNTLYLNPGAAGREGFHHVRTAMRFTLESGKVSGMEVLELGLRGARTTSE